MSDSNSDAHEKEVNAAVPREATVEERAKELWRNKRNTTPDFHRDEVVLKHWVESTSSQFDENEKREAKKLLNGLATTLLRNKKRPSRSKKTAEQKDASRKRALEKREKSEANKKRKGETETERVARAEALHDEQIQREWNDQITKVEDLKRRWNDYYTEDRVYFKEDQSILQEFFTNAVEILPFFKKEMMTNDDVQRNLSATHVLFLKSVQGSASSTAVIFESYPGEIIWASSYQQTLRGGAAEVPEEVRTAGRYRGGRHQPEKYVQKAKAVSDAVKSVDMHMKKVVDITNSVRKIPSVVDPVVVPPTQAGAPIIHDTTNFDRLKSEAEQNLKQLCDTLKLLREEEVSIKLRDLDAPVCLSLFFLGSKKNPILPWR